MTLSVTAMAEIAEYEYQLEQILGALEADPENSELLTLKNELQDLIKLTKSQTEPPILSATTSGTKYSSESTEKKRKIEQPETRKVGDQVLAKWITGDHQFYAARITSITGNQHDPVYTVKFTEYNEVQTLHGHQLRNVNEYKRRALEAGSSTKASKANATPSVPRSDESKPPPPPGTVSSSPSSNPRKPKGSLKEDLSQNANKWSTFAKSGPKTKQTVGKKKAIGEGSMFRTEENGRVGVIGSGRAMTSDPGKRGRHVFQPER